MARNLIVCCDGTANEFKKDRTNVVKLFSTLVKDPAAQASYYHPGVGTMAPPGIFSKTGARLAEAAGMAFGYGLNNDIRDAYVFIADNYRADDRLFMFGFSRGAYTVRAVAALLHMYGLLPPGNDPLVPYTVRMMWEIHRLQKTGRKGAPPDPRISEYFELAREFKATYSRVCKPHFVGVWDTVSSVGWFAHPLSLPYTTSNPDIAIGRHAVAIDECRAFFRTNLWRRSEKAAESGPADLKQVWFPGIHCDIGGGYPEETDIRERLQTCEGRRYFFRSTLSICHGVLPGKSAKCSYALAISSNCRRFSGSLAALASCRASLALSRYSCSLTMTARPRITGGGAYAKTVMDGA